MRPAADPVAAVRSKFLARCRHDVEVMEAALADPAGAREDLKMVVHRLSGAAGVFGFRDISHQAGCLDETLQDGEDPPPGEIQALVDAVKAIL